MLSRSQRLSSREFAVVFDNSRVLRHPLLQLRFYRHQDDQQKSKPRAGQTRAAFVAPKKLGNAVVRNAIRRRVRERYRILQSKAQNKALPLQHWHAALENCDLVFLATAQCQAATIEEIDESLSSLLKRAARN